MKILVLNSGSSSLKFQLFEMPEGTVICSGLVENIGEQEGVFHFNFKGEKSHFKSVFKNHSDALHKVAETLMDPLNKVISSPNDIEAVGHRVVHGGEKFIRPTLINEEVKAKIKELFSLAPLHNPPNFQGIEVSEEVFSHAPQIAIFDTAFHNSMPEKAFRIAIPNELYEKFGIRNYGFHGTSHQYISRKAISYLGLEKSKIITIHLGNGCSMAAIKDGQCIDVSMGLGPLSGLIMGTRPGDIDPSVIFYLADNGYSMDEIRTILNKKSGMKGLTGENDLRTIKTLAKNGSKDAINALEMYAYRIKKYVGSYIAALGGIDAIVFTAGVGENDPLTREKSLEGLEILGIVIDKAKNENRGEGMREIQKGAVKILIIPTDEELEIANQVYELLNV